MIEAKDLSFLVTGPIIRRDKLNNIDSTQELCTSIRNYFPGSKIIISTWLGENTKDVDFDTIIFNQDPGNFNLVLEDKIVQNNANRMIVSSKNGLKAVTTKYCIRLRSDLVFMNNNILRMKVDKKLISLTGINARREKKLFMISDWFHFGETITIRKFWDIDLLKHSDLICNNGKINLQDNLSAEQYLWKKYLSNYENFDEFIKYDDINEFLLRKFENALMKTTMLYSAPELGINSLKYPDNLYAIKNFMRFQFYTSEDLLLIDTSYQTRKRLLNYKSHFFGITFYKIYRFIEKSIFTKMYIQLKKR